MQSELGQLPVQGNDTVEILVNDHEVIKGIMSELKDATKLQDRQDALERLKAALTIHNATEENLVYPALAKVAHKKAESAHLYQETAEADVLIFEIDSMLKEGDDTGLDRKVEKLQSAILEHMDGEERKAFPALQKNAPPEQAQMLTDSVREFRSEFRFSPSGSRTEKGEIRTERSRSR